jgi:hypothetical protein
MSTTFFIVRKLMDAKTHYTGTCQRTAPRFGNHITIAEYIPSASLKKSCGHKCLLIQLSTLLEHEITREPEPWRLEILEGDLLHSFAFRLGLNFFPIPPQNRLHLP